MKKAFAIIGAWALAAGGLVAVHVTSSDAAPPVPLFTQCPPVDTDTGCAVLLRLNADGSTTTLTDPNQPPLSSADGRDDVLIGVQNNRADTVTSIGVSSNVAAFAFDGDGLCASTPPVPVGCPFDPSNTAAASYAGPNTSFSNISVDQKSGRVNFTGGIAPLGSAY